MTIPDRQALVLAAVFGLQAVRCYLVMPVYRLVKGVLDWGARNFWCLAFVLGLWYYSLEKSGAFESSEVMMAQMAAGVSVFALTVPVYRLGLGFLLCFLVVWIYREVWAVFWDLIMLAKRWIARTLLISLYLLYRFRGKESEAVYYLGGQPSLKERLMVYGAMGAAALRVAGTGYLEITAALPPL